MCNKGVENRGRKLEIKILIELNMEKKNNILNKDKHT